MITENKNQDPIVTKGKLRLDYSDGTYSEVEFMMPKEISEDIVESICTWEKSYLINTKGHKAYQKAEKEYKATLEKNLEELNK